MYKRPQLVIYSFLLNCWCSYMEQSQYQILLGSLPYLCTKNETMAPLHVATLTAQRELPKYEIIFSI